MAEEKEAEAKAEATTEVKTEEVETEVEHVNYQTLYEEEKQRRVKAESIIQRHSEKKPEEESGDDPSDLVERIRGIIQEEITPVRSELLKEKVGSAIGKATADPEEARLIQYHLENSIKPSGDLELDVENAKALANKKRVSQEREELLASLRSKETISDGSVSGRKKLEQKDAELPPLTRADQVIINNLREKYVLSNDAIRRIMKGEQLPDLLAQNIVKKR